MEVAPKGGEEGDRRDERCKRHTSVSVVEDVHGGRTRTMIDGQLCQDKSTSKPTGRRDPARRVARAIAHARAPGGWPHRSQCPRRRP